MKKIITSLILLSICVLLFAKNVPKLNVNGEKKVQTFISKDAKLNRGESLVLAVRTPQGENLSAGNEWIPQYLQDSLTGKMAKYSLMKIVDRTNEKMIIAEQKIAESALTDDTNIIEIGKITNAKLISVGTVRQLSTGFEINIRVNDIETNEIKASYSNRVSLSDIENGNVVNECVIELFTGLGIQLKEDEREKLKITDRKENKAVTALAKGDVAQQNGQYIEALSYFVDAQKNEATKKNASNEITKIFNGRLDATDIKVRMEWQKSETARWEKILNEWDDYRKNNLMIIVYDFSQTVMEPCSGYVNIIVKPGIKVFVDRKALDILYSVYKKFCEYQKENEWLDLSFNSRLSWNGYLTTSPVSIYLGVFDESGYCWSERDESFSEDAFDFREWNVKNQKGLFNDAGWGSVRLELSEKELSEISGELSIKITKMRFSYNDWNPRIFSLEEWNEYLTDLE